MNDDQLAKILSLWHFSENGVCSNISRDCVMAHLRRAVPECDCAKLFNSFIYDKSLKLNDSGDGYVLGAAMTERYRELQKRGLITTGYTRTTNLSLQQQWEHFRKLLDYYIDCARHNARKQEALFCSDYQKSFFMPLLHTVIGGWLKPLSEDTRTVDVEIPYNAADKGAMAIICGEAQTSGEDIYIGYPVEQFLDKAGKPHYSPICLLPVELLQPVHPSIDARIRIRIHLDDADINFSWLERGVRQNERQTIVNALQALPVSDAFKGCRAKLTVQTAFPSSSSRRFGVFRS